MSSQRQSPPESAAPAPQVRTPPPRRSVFFQIMRRLFPAFVVIGSVLVAVLIIGLAQRVGWIRSERGDATEQTAGADTIYTCPMHPAVRQPNPGRCPICGMELVKATSVTDKYPLSVEIDPAARRVADIRTAVVERLPLKRQVTAVGSVTYDESRLRRIITYVGGRVEKLVADYTGYRVNQGDTVMTLYSPDLYIAQKEFLDNLKAAEQDGPARYAVFEKKLLEASRHKLTEQFGMTEQQVAHLEESGKAETRTNIQTKMGGTVIEKSVVEGQEVKPGDTILKIADLSVVWLLLELFPEDAANIRYGHRVEAEFKSLPGGTFVGRVSFIDPSVDPQTQTVGVRVVIENKDNKLRIGDYATARIDVPISADQPVFDPDLAGKWISPRHPQVILDEPGPCPICGINLEPTSKHGFSRQPTDQPLVLVVPRSAVMAMGTNSVVYVEVEPGRFEIRRVTTGTITADKIVVLNGLKEGEMVATSGNFLIDSKMQIAGKPSLIDPNRARIAPPGPMKLDRLEMVAVAGDAGESLEAFFEAYFVIQDSLAMDKAVGAEQAATLQARAKSLLASSDLADELKQLIRAAAESAEHLHHQPLKQARESFKEISRNVIRLAAQARGSDSSAPFVHFYCSMVDDGRNGDWLQDEATLANPYWGSQMLRCGEKVHELPAARVAAETKPPAHEHPDGHQPELK